MKLLTEFKKFAMRGNVLDMAVGIIIGAAFGKIVDSLVKDMIMPPLGILLGKIDFANLFFVFGVGVIIYVLIAQCVGIGTIFSSMFGVPYEIGASVPIIIVAIYIAKAGLRGSLFNDVIQFFIISIIMIISVPLILRTLGVENIYNGMVDVVTNPDNINYNPEALNLLAGGGLRYGLTAIVVASGQVLLDQGYYSKAIKQQTQNSY